MSATNQPAGFLIYGGFLLAIVGLLFFLIKKSKQHKIYSKHVWFWLL